MGLRNIGAAVKRLAVGRKEYAHGPPALPVHRHDGIHVDFVYVGVLFAIHFHADEIFIEGRTHFVEFKALLLHHVAPVTSRVADGEKYDLVLALRPFEGFLTPWVPVYGVMGMLLEVRAFFLSE